MSMTPGSAPPAPAPILIGVIYDFPQADGGASVEEAIHLGLAEVSASGRLDRPFELVARQARGLPGGSAHDVETTYAELVDSGVLAVVGPSISDNGLIVAPLADAAGVPTINYTGGEQTRSEFMFHYQVGSLQEEPVVLVDYLVRRGITSVAAIYDNSPVGRGYAESLSEAEQEVLRLKFQDGLKYHEIANVTGRTTNYVGVLIHAAIKKLRAQLQADEPAKCGE